MAMIALNPMTDPDTLECIFSFLSLSPLCIVARVCKLWQRQTHAMLTCWQSGSQWLKVELHTTSLDVLSECLICLELRRQPNCFVLYPNTEISDAFRVQVLEILITGYYSSGVNMRCCSIAFFDTCFNYAALLTTLVDLPMTRHRATHMIQQLMPHISTNSLHLRLFPVAFVAHGSQTFLTCDPTTETLLVVANIVRHFSHILCFKFFLKLLYTYDLAIHHRTFWKTLGSTNQTKSIENLICVFAAAPLLYDIPLRIGDCLQRDTTCFLSNRALLMLADIVRQTTQSNSLTCMRYREYLQRYPSVTQLNLI